MSTRHYDPRTGVVTTCDDSGVILTRNKVKFLDITLPPDGIPKYPELDYLEQFGRIAHEVIRAVNARYREKGKGKLILDEYRLSNFKGAGFRDGDYVVFVVRDDKAGSANMSSDADYRYEMRGRDSLNVFEVAGETGLLHLFEDALKAILDKQ